MTTGKTIFGWLETLANTSGSNAKKELVAEYMQDDLFQQVMRAALDPFTTYGVKKFASPCGDAEMDEYCSDCDGEGIVLNR